MSFPDNIQTHGPIKGAGGTKIRTRVVLFFHGVRLPKMVCRAHLQLSDIFNLDVLRQAEYRTYRPI